METERHWLVSSCVKRNWFLQKCLYPNLVESEYIVSCGKLGIVDCDVLCYHIPKAIRPGDYGPTGNCRSK